VGIVANVRFTELLDFMLGFTTFDLCGDDGHKISKWPWQPDSARETMNMPFRATLPY